ncbi:hypothetical protein Clacol_004722 [Clathrus columnatus]|uniref:VWFA domain-containing protein n=1 Tax=Clathrus columnatus TaxID=1419009 RepID=A0AAV5ABU3_9AGAM|nr:hypothetical protein Clacol_004722 [Clathrus columnatus]
MLDFAEHLRDSALGPFLNFSSAVVLNQWYIEALDKMNEWDCSTLRSCVAEFAKEIRLTTGHGMHQIWKALTCRCVLFVDLFLDPIKSLESNFSTDIGISRRSANTEIDGHKYYRDSSLLAVVEMSWIDSVFQRLFRGSDNSETGPAVLLTPVLLRDVVSLWYVFVIACFLVTHTEISYDDVTFYNLNKQPEGFLLHTRILLDQCQKSLDRLGQLYTLWLGSVCLLAECFRDTYSTEDREAIHDAGAHTKTSVLAASLVKTSDYNFSQIVAKRVIPFLEPLQSKGNKSPSHLARAWIELGTGMLELYLPDFPMDPLASEKSTFDFLKKGELKTSTLLEFAEHAAESFFGDRPTPLSSLLSAELRNIRNKLREYPDPSFRKVDLSRLHCLFDEIRSFIHQFIFNDKFSNLVAATAYSREVPVLMPEISTVRHSITGFLQRLDKGYTDLSDIVHPISVALLFIQFGLHLFSAVSEANTSTNILNSSLIEFPTAAAIDIPLHKDLTPKQSLYFLLASSYKYVLENSATAGFVQLGEVFDKAATLWLRQNTTEEQQARASQSLYRHKTVDSSLEDDSADFYALFPLFSDSSENTLDLGTKPQTDDESLVLSSSMKHIIYITHRMITCHIKELGTFKKIEEQFWQLRRDLLLHILTVEGSLPELDRDSLPLRLSILWKGLMCQPHQQTSYNFYYDSNISETKKAFVVVSGLRDRLLELLQKWPDQMILRHVQDQCDTILQFSVQSSIARVLSSLEKLVMQVADWESYANRENSLALHQTAITDIIVSWRRTELSSWSNLFESEVLKFETETVDWWARMYDLTVRGSLHAESLDTYLVGIISVIDEFISTSSLGQYRYRLQLVFSFAEHAHLLCLSGTHEKRLRPVGVILRALHGYYLQFDNAIHHVINEKRKPLEKELRDYIKLASWKDINVYALQQSAQRTHRQLYKCIRKFRDILKESVAPYLSIEEGFDTEHPNDCSVELEFLLSPSAVEFPAIEIQNPSIETPAYLANLSKTFVNFRKIAESSGQRFIQALPYRRIEDFAIEILTTSTQLSSDTDATAGSDLKAHKILFMRKRRAWVDLLQGLKHLGFSARIKPGILQRQTDRFWLLNHPLPEVEENNRAYVLASKNKTYFNKLLVLMPALRGSFSSHHPDVATGDLQRALNFTESSYNFFLTAYTRYCTDCGHYEDLKRLTNRIASLSKCRSDTSIEIVEDIQSWHRTCLGLQDAINELLINCNRLTELHGSLLLSPTVVESITSCLAILKDDEEILSHLQHRVVCLNPPLMSAETADEVQQLHLIRGRIAAVSTSLQQWMEEEPRLQHFCRPIITWLNRSMPSGNASVDTFVVDGGLRWSERKIIELLLLTAQTVRSQSQKYQIPNDASKLEGVALTCASYSGELSNAFGTKNILTGLESFLVNLRSSSTKDRITALQRITPFLDTYLQLVDSVLYLQAAYVKASGKLTYVLARLILSISQKGFCKPPSEAEDQRMDESSKEQTQDGTGFGEGTGKEDIGQEVGDESQVEGLQGEEGKGESGEAEGNDEGIEIDGVDGETQDLDVDESGSESEEPQDDIEDVVGDLEKGDSENIDEKLWEGEHEDDKQQSDQAGKDSKSVGKDTAAQTSEESKSSAEETLEDDNAPDGDNPVDTDDNAPPIDAGKQLEQSVQEESVLDLPDDINIDQSEKGNSDGDVEDVPGDEDEEVDSRFDAHSIGGDDPVEEEGGPEDQMLPTQEDFQEQPNAEDNTDGTMEDSSRGNQGVAPNQNQNSTEDALVADADDPTNTEAADTTAETLQDNSGIGNEGLNQGTNTSSVDYGAMDVDHHDTLDGEPIAMGDASKPIHRQWQDIDSADLTRPSVSTSNLPTRVEYVPESAEDPNDIQALGPAKDKKPIATEDVQMLDEEERDQPDQKNENVRLSDSKSLPPTAKETEKSKPPHGDRPSESQAESQEANGPTSSDRLLAEAQMIEMIGDASISEETVEQITKKWCEIGRPESLAGHVWRLYESLTRDLSFMLCEQLRLILAPTLATRLKGDYKTGKKLNMKKIIPYIASDYTKDKIWLRRTRPSQREYQILVALDDSRSMGESHSIHLAYETLALVTKALNRLEAGEIAIASFGETFELAHRFEDGMVGEREGEKLMKSFNFSQSKTDILGLIQKSVDMLLEARERRSVSAKGSSGDLWQLEIIISDGICQDHEQLRNALRMAEEHRILVVFIVIDSLHTQNQNQATATGASNQAGQVQSSILNMNQVSYQNINGKMELQLSRYLDTFPFQYYLILREVEALPDVLANTLKQFFERISEQ